MKTVKLHLSSFELFFFVFVETNSFSCCAENTQLTLMAFIRKPVCRRWDFDVSCKYNGDKFNNKNV